MWAAWARHTKSPSAVWATDLPPPDFEWISTRCVSVCIQRRRRRTGHAAGLLSLALQTASRLQRAGFGARQRGMAHRANARWYGDCQLARFPLASSLKPLASRFTPHASRLSPLASRLPFFFFSFYLPSDRFALGSANFISEAIDLITLISEWSRASGRGRVEYLSVAPTLWISARLSVCRVQACYMPARARCPRRRCLPPFPTSDPCTTTRVLRISRTRRACKQLFVLR